jgi:hypothetical protein
VTLTPIPRAHLVRDAALVAATLLLWAADAALRGSPGAFPLLVAVLAGALTAVAGYLAHEWGHFVGARLSGSLVHLPSSPRAVFLFQFDRTNTRRQFLAMSLGGFAASTVVVVLLLRTLPLSVLSGRIALALSALGVLAAIVTEVPVFWRVARGAPIPRGAAYVEAG